MVGRGRSGSDAGGRPVGLMFEGLYREPSLGHLVALVRYYVHAMESVASEEVSVSGIVSRRVGSWAR